MSGVGERRAAPAGDVYRRDDPLPAGEDVGDGDAPRLGRRQTADHLLCPRHLAAARVTVVRPGVATRQPRVVPSKTLTHPAPRSRYYRALKKIGELFPGPSKTTRAYLHPEEAVVNALTVGRQSARHTRAAALTEKPRPLFCAGVGLQDLADGDDGHQLLLLATAGGRARLGGW
jgi:hypothetical protein